jgi:hypothetical protein
MAVKGLFATSLALSGLKNINVSGLAGIHVTGRVIRQANSPRAITRLSDPCVDCVNDALFRHLCVPVRLLIHDMATIVITTPIRGEFKHRADDADEGVTFERSDFGEGALTRLNYANRLVR